MVDWRSKMAQMVFQCCLVLKKLEKTGFFGRFSAVAGREGYDLRMRPIFPESTHQNGTLCKISRISVVGKKSTPPPPLHEMVTLTHPLLTCCFNK